MIKLEDKLAVRQIATVLRDVAVLTGAPWRTVMSWQEAARAALEFGPRDIEIDLIVEERHHAGGAAHE